MCRHFHLALRPIELEPANDIVLERLEYARKVVEDCSKKNTKAGYDAAGLAVLKVALPRGPVGTSLSSAELLISRDGGDLLRIWDDLCEDLGLGQDDLILHWQSHIRQATQGSLYAARNAHPHSEHLSNGKLLFYQSGGPTGLTCTELDVGNEKIFAESHNGDIYDSVAYKRFLSRQGFEILSDSDSCVTPALKRFIYEHLIRGSLKECLLILSGQEPTGGDASAKIDEEQAFLRDDADSDAMKKVSELMTLSENLHNGGAHPVTVATGITARVLEYSNRDNKFVLQTISTVGEAPTGVIGAGTFNLVRGGTFRGGQPGGEAVFYIPQSYDIPNYTHSVALAGSEENSFKDVVTLLDEASRVKGIVEPAKPRNVQLNHLNGLSVEATITEGCLPVYDVNPGEVLEITADGNVRLYDIYKGELLKIVPAIDPLNGNLVSTEIDSNDSIRNPRWARLKSFRTEYKDQDGRPAPCPYNKYGEEIKVVQPFALGSNSERIFTSKADGSIELRKIDGSPLGLTFGKEDGTDRESVIQSLQTKIIVGAGTSFLIGQVSESVCRMLRLNSLHTEIIEGFTGTAAPPPTDSATLLLAISNSGGTSDTIHFVENVATPLAWSNRVLDHPALKDYSETEINTASSCRDRLMAGKPMLADDLEFLKVELPWLYSLTSIEASPLGNMGAGVNPRIINVAGRGIMDIPEEECVGSTFAALASLQWLIALDTFLGETRGDITSEYARKIYEGLRKVPECIANIVSDSEIERVLRDLSQDLTGGNSDFIFTDYLNGVAEEQAHKAAEMIQEMFIGFHYFMFQHGKYAHVKQKGLRNVGSVVAHNSPPRTLPELNNRAKKAPMEIKTRAGHLVMICHQSDVSYFESLEDYRPDYILAYPEDDPVLYPFQVIAIAQLLSYVWGERKLEIGKQIHQWNRPLVEILMGISATSDSITKSLRKKMEPIAVDILRGWTELGSFSVALDKVETRRNDFVKTSLRLLSSVPVPNDVTIQLNGVFGSHSRKIVLTSPCGANQNDSQICDSDYLAIMKELALELSTRVQAKELAEHFYGDVGSGSHNSGIDYFSEIDFYVAYEGLGALFEADAVHPPKIAKAKKGWL